MNVSLVGSVAPAPVKFEGLGFTNPSHRVLPSAFALIVVFYTLAASEKWAVITLRNFN